MRWGWLVVGAIASVGCDEHDDGGGAAIVHHDDRDDSESTGDTESDGDAEACDEQNAVRACDLAAGGEGTQICAAPGFDEPLQWSTCVVELECTPGETTGCDSEGEDGEELRDSCVIHDGLPQWTCSFEEFCACATPLVLSFDGAEPSLSSASAAAFDIDVAGGCLSTDWPEAHTPWLALDRDGDGAIADGRELFGSGTRLASGKRAAHGFAALAELDDNLDGVIDARDPGFAKLVLWGDRDLDKRGTALELEPVAGRVLALELGYASARRCDDRGNCGIERASFTWIDAGGSLRTGEIVDLHLACQ